MRRMTDPQNVQALAQMQQSMQQLQRAGLFPGMPGAGGGPDFGPGMAGLGGFGNLNLGGDKRVNILSNVWIFMEFSFAPRWSVLWHRKGRFFLTTLCGIASVNRSVY